MDTRRSALLIIDVQNDFCPGGALPVPEGDQVVPVLNRLAERAGAVGLPVYASRDWHPPESVHFKSGGGPWPVHCVAGTPGAQFHPDLRLPPGTLIVSAGTSGQDDGYSAFEGRIEGGGSFEEDLRARGITHLIVGGLATDYCVRASVLDARRLGIDVTVVTDAVRAINVQPGDGERALQEMQAAGAELKTSDEVLS